MASFHLKEGRKYKEDGVKYAGPCEVKSKHEDLHKRFPTSFELLDDQETQVPEQPSGENPTENQENSTEHKNGAKSFSRGKKKRQTAEYGVNEQYTPPNLTPQHRGGGKYNVLRGDGTQFNDNLMTKKEAYELCGLEVPE